MPYTGGLFFTFIILFHLYEVHLKSVSVPLLDKMKAPLSADLDMSGVRKYIDDSMADAIKSAEVDTVMSSKFDLYVNSLLGNISTLELKDKELETKVKKLEANLDAMKDATNGESVSSQYAFYAYMSHDEPDPRANHRLIYDVVHSNVGSAYNKYTGIFTIPQDGVYSFSWATRVQCGKAHTTQLVVNIKVLGSTYGWCGYNTVTGNVITKASKGDAVYVRTHRTVGGQGAIKSNEYGRSSFSGFLLY